MVRSTGSVFMNSKAMTWAAVGMCFIAGSYFSPPIYAEAAYAGSVEEPATKLAFPIHLNTDKTWKRLVGFGVRCVTFLNMNVYVVGMYMTSEDIGHLKKIEKFKVTMETQKKERWLMFFFFCV